jgi:hypothetical protein
MMECGDRAMEQRVLAESTSVRKLNGNFASGNDEQVNIAWDFGVKTAL